MLSLNCITDCCAFYYCHIDILILIVDRCLCCPYRCCHETGRQNTHSLNILTIFFVLLDLNSHFQFHTFYPLFAWLTVKLSRWRQHPPLFVAVAAHLPPPDALLSSWVIVKSSHRLRCPPLFVAVAARPPPPAALLSRRRCLSLNRRAAAPFIVVPLVLLSSLRHRCHP